MKSFDEWFENEMPNSHKEVGKEKIETVIYSCAESAWNHKQAEVDELQKRIDEAIYDLQHIESAMWEEQVEHVLMILKGNKDEN